MAKTTENKAPKAKSTTAAPKTKSQPKAGEAGKAKSRTGGASPAAWGRAPEEPSQSRQAWLYSADLDPAIPKLGQPGDLVKVRPGFARNYLVPQGLATFATQNNLRMVEKHRERLKQLEEARRMDLQNLAAQLAQRSLTIEANANAEGHLYGSVNADQIAESLRNEGFPIQAENVRIEGPLKELGLYSIKIQLAQEIQGEVKLWVVPTHTEETAG